VILLQTAHVSKSFGAHRVLRDVSLTIHAGGRSGIVGLNGAGKTTLLKIITGNLQPDTGEVSRPKGLKLSYLAQDAGLESEQSIWTEMLSAFTSLTAMEFKLRDMEKMMSDPSLAPDTNTYRQLLIDYDSLTVDFKNKGGYEYETAIRGVLHGLKFSEQDYDTPVKSLSGGQKTRLALARSLLGAPDLLVLDEPTNYLDMDNLNWLEQYLKAYPGAVLVVSHDRYFLDALAKEIYDLDGGCLTRYVGNYTSYARQKEAALAQQLRDYNRQQAEISRLEDFVRRNIAAKDTAGQARSRLKVLDKMRKLDRPGSERKIAVSFNIKRTSGREVLQAGDLNIGYPGLTLAQGLKFEIARGERVALIGPNGIGKSTLLKTIAGLIQPLSGQVRLGSYVQMGYYDQEQHGLDRGKQVLHELWDRYPHIDEADIRTVLGRFLFRGDDVKKSVADLSGGEKSRLALAALMLQQANFLVLDEPTSHLDLPGREVLEESLTGYPGTLLFVSHDRYFINKIAGRILCLSPGGMQNYHGNYDYYLYKRSEQTQQPPVSPSGSERAEKTAEKKQYLFKKEEDRQKRRRQRKIEELEQDIARLEDLVSRLEKELYLPQNAQNYENCLRIQTDLDQARAKLQEQMEIWLSIVEGD